MVFFAFHQYLTTNFHVNNFFCGNYISVLFATWNDVSIYFVSNISLVILVFNFCRSLCYLRKKPQYFTFFCKTFEEFNNDFYVWKSEVTTTKKGKIFNISPNIAHFLIKFSYRASCLTVQYTVNLMIFLYFALNLETLFKICDFLEKFILSFFFEQDQQHCFITLLLFLYNTLMFF